MAEKSPWELADLLKGYIKASGKTQRQIADEAGMPLPTYLSQMANAKINWVRSDYFPALVRVLGLKEEDVRLLRPEAVIELPKPANTAPTETDTLPAFTMPEALQQAISENSERYPQLLSPRWQRVLAALRWRTGVHADPKRYMAAFKDMLLNDIDPDNETQN